jgi:hypothetical protein
MSRLEGKSVGIKVTSGHPWVAAADWYGGCSGAIGLDLTW